MTQDEIDEIKYGPKSSEHDDANESGWTAEGALRFYAAGKNYDIVGDRVRILDNGAVASDALKGMSPEYAATKGCSEKQGETPRTDTAWGPDARDWGGDKRFEESRKLERELAAKERMLDRYRARVDELLHEVARSATQRGATAKLRL